MINLTIDWQEVIVDFMGEKVTAEIRPLSTIAFATLSPLFNEVAATAGVDPNDIKALSQLAELLKKSKEVLPSHLRELKGVQINGENPTVDQLCEEFTLCPLTIALLTEMMTLSVLDSGSEKNLQSPPQ